MTQLQQTAHTQNMLGRAWRYLDDEIISRKLFEVIANQPAIWSPIVIVLILALYGALSGRVLPTLIFQWFGLAALLSRWTLMLIGAFVGGGIGWLGLVFQIPPNGLTWGEWLKRLLPTLSFDRSWPLHWIILPVLLPLGSGLGIAFASIILGSRNSFDFGPAVILLFGFTVATSFLGSPKEFGMFQSVASPFTSLILFMVASVFLTVFDPTSSFREGFGFFNLPLRWPLTISFFIGSLTGIIFGRHAGLLALTISQVMAVAVFELIVLNRLIIESMFYFYVPMWLAGLWLGGLLSLFFPISDDDSLAAKLFPYRSWAVWWHRLPQGSELEKVLIESKVWSNFAEQIATYRQSPESTGVLINDLRHQDWMQRLMAQITLLVQGHEAIPQLVQISQTSSSNLRSVAQQLLNNIQYDTTQRLARHVGSYYCEACLVQCGQHTLPTLTYFGCRRCGQWQEFVTFPQGVIAVLADDEPEISQLKDGPVRVNWLRRRELFDFDRVEIVDATDEDVERLVVQIGNDTDLVRASRYPEMVCTVASTCRLSDNSMRLLSKTFERVDGVT